MRGTIERVEGQTLVVQSREGAELKVVLADNALVVGLVKASLSDIKPGSFVGVTGMPQADGSQKALEVHIFPEAMRGTGEGHRPWDLRPHFIAAANKQPDGKLQAPRVNFGKDGLSPPM